MLKSYVGKGFIDLKIEAQKIFSGCDRLFEMSRANLLCNLCSVRFLRLRSPNLVGAIT
jgi:hypothetical protein